MKLKLIKKRNKKKKVGGSEIPFRLNFLFFIVFLLFAALIAQLAQLQIIHGNKYEAEANSGNTLTETRNVERGMVYDSSGKLVAANNTSRAITYTKPISVSNSEMYEIANKLVQYVTIDTDQLSKSNKVDYYLGNKANLKRVNSHIKGYSSMKGTALYKAETDYVESHGLTDNMTEKQKQAAMVFGRMNGAYSLSTVYLKINHVTDQEMALVGAHLSQLPGVKIGTSWARSYPDGGSIKSVIGTVTTEKQGLPSDKINSLLSEGYSRNDSVGSSYIESQYEDVLKGSKSIINVETQNGKIKKEVKEYGCQEGDSLVLTINSAFQRKVQNIMMSAEKSVGSGNAYSPGAYAVVMNPRTGAILALGGASRNLSTGKVSENAIGTINQTFVMGSVVKGATVMGALKDGVITPENSTQVDEPIKLAGTPSKTSWFNKSGGSDMSLTASDALMVSSNVYMMKLAMLEGHFKYAAGKALTMSPKVFSTLRGYFHQFGLGVKTGIDIPGESTGFEGPSGTANIGKALDLSFGQYDSYTTMQLAQYISTVANGGYRLQPHILQAIRTTNPDGTLGATKYEFQPNVLNVVSGTSAQWNVVHTGLYKVVHGDSNYRTGRALATVEPAVAAKTGTAETYHGTTPTTTLSGVTYAPYNNPQVAIAVAFPGLSSDSSTINTDVIKEIYSAYWKMVQSDSGFSTKSTDTTSQAQ